MRKLNIGDFVAVKTSDSNSRFDIKYVGNISKVYNQCPQTNEWLAKLKNPIPSESVRSTWYTVRILNGGEICLPAYLLLTIE